MLMVLISHNQSANNQFIMNPSQIVHSSGQASHWKQGFENMLRDSAHRYPVDKNKRDINMMEIEVTLERMSELYDRFIAKHSTRNKHSSHSPSSPSQ